MTLCPSLRHVSGSQCLSFLCGLAVLALAGSALAQTSSEVLLLRSTAGHEGANRWTMARASELKADAAAISQPGFSAAGWQEAVVPGTVLNSLVRNGVYPEPYFGVNNAHEKKLIPDLKDAGLDFYTYWFRTEFAAPKDFQGRQVWLQLDGINYRAEVWLNGRRLGDMAGMFQRGLFNATDAVRFRRAQRAGRAGQAGRRARRLQAQGTRRIRATGRKRQRRRRRDRTQRHHADDRRLGLHVQRRHPRPQHRHLARREALCHRAGPVAEHSSSRASLPLPKLAPAARRSAST